MDNLAKQIKELEKRIAKLEKGNETMFGRSYNLVGESNSDLLLKTRGLVKILWGGKFIDLIKNGKINADSEVIFSTASKDSIGTNNGIYITDNNEVYLKLNSNVISLLGDSGNTYVSFMENQETDALAKYNAFVNIGFIYKDRDSITENSLQNGIIYLESDQKLYIILDGQLIEYTLQVPNPYPNLFVISANGQANSALAIEGVGENNSLAFIGYKIYSEDNLNIKADDTKVISVNKNNTTISNKLIVNEISSSDKSFQLLASGNFSILKVDKISAKFWSLNVLDNLPENTVLLLLNGDDIPEGWLEYTGEYIAIIKSSLEEEEETE